MTALAVDTKAAAGEAATNGDTLLELRGVHTYYGHIHALQGVDVAVVSVHTAQLQQRVAIGRGLPGRGFGVDCKGGHAVGAPR